MDRETITERDRCNTALQHAHRNDVCFSGVGVWDGDGRARSGDDELVAHHLEMPSIVGAYVPSGQELGEGVRERHREVVVVGALVSSSSCLCHGGYDTPVGRAGGQRFCGVTFPQPDNDYPIVALGPGSPRAANAPLA